MTPQLERPRRSAGAILTALALTFLLPTSALSSHGHPNPTTSFINVLAAGGFTVPLINSGETFDGIRFQGIPDGIGAVPGDGYVDLYVTHEESTVPFGILVSPAFEGFADLQASSVSRVRVDTTEQEVIELEVALGPEAGFVRFCSAFMAGPEHGFANYTFLVNEEADETIHPVPPGAVYGADPFLAPNRQAGYSVWLDTETGVFDVISRAGRHNHENTVVIPGGWKNLAILSGDDTFLPPSSQLYLYTANDAEQMMADKGQLWAFQVTATNGIPLADPYDPFAVDAANDYLEIMAGDDFSGRFIHVPTDVARGVTGEAPQAALENWSNANNVFQFVRVEDIAYHPDHPREVYFADTGSSRLAEDPETGRLVRLGSGGTTSNGRIFKMVLNEKDPRIVDSFRIFADSADAASAFVNPDNLDVGHSSIMVQEDASSANSIWMYSFGSGTWTEVAQVTGTGSSAESSGIISLEDIPGFVAGWWALDVQGHRNLDEFTDPQPGGTQYQWAGPPSTATGPYSKRLEEGQLLLMYIPGS